MESRLACRDALVRCGRVGREDDDVGAAFSLRARQVRNAFGQYLSPALVEQLADHPEQLKLGGETKEMTFLFCDVRNFTAISESYKSDPQRLTTLINRLLTPRDAVFV